MSSERSTSARLLERLVADPALRARYQQDPMAVAHELGLEQTGLEVPSGSVGWEALEARESRSGLAGVLMAAAVEGLALGGVVHAVPAARAAAIPDEDLDEGGGALEPVDDDEGGGEKGGDIDGGAPALDDDEVGDGDDDEPSDDDEAEPDDVDEEEPDEEEPDEDESDDEDFNDEADSGDGESDEQEPVEQVATGGEDAETDPPPADANGQPDPVPGAEDTPDEEEPEADVEAVADGASATDYPGDAAPREALAAWMAAGAKARGLPPELPVMASLVESGLKNLPGGDRDSIGFFQMRSSIWDRGPYAGYAKDPARQLDWFLDQAQAVRAQRLARDLPIDDPQQYGTWIADVERPAAEYRGRYHEQLDAAQQLVAEPRKTDVSGPAEDLAEPGGPTHAGRRAVRALALARTQLGRPYLWGGTTPKGGFDCSGLVQWAYAKSGIRIPRVTQDQILAPAGDAVSRRKLLPGDLVFFSDAGDVHHVGISLGGDRFLHAPKTGDVIKESSMKEPWFREHFAGARRFDAAVGRDRANDARVMTAIDPAQRRR